MEKVTPSIISSYLNSDYRGTERNLQSIRLKQKIYDDCYFTNGPYTLASGDTSDFYYDLRKLTMSAEGLYLIGELFFPTIVENDIHQVGGVATSGMPIVSAILMVSGKYGWDLNGFYIVLDKKEHGRGGQIFGNPGMGRTMLFDDVLTTGNSLADAIKVMLDYPISPWYPVSLGVILDRCVDEGSAEKALETLKNKAHCGTYPISLVTHKEIQEMK